MKINLIEYKTILHFNKIFFMICTNLLIYFYQGHLLFIAELTNFLPKILDMVKFLCSYIINYKSVYKPASTKNYLQYKTSFKDDKRFFTYQQYQQNRSICDSYKKNFHHLVSLIGQVYFNILKSILYTEKSAIG